MKAKILSPSDLRLILSIAQTPREQAMVLLSCKAGLRAKEIAGLTWGCIRQEDTVLELARTKGDVPREVPINKDLRDALRAWRAVSENTADDAPVFTGVHVNRHRPLSANAVAQWFRYFYMERAKLSGCSSHSGRRTFATNAARKATTVGGSLRDVQEMLGHASLTTTQEYLEGSSDAKRRLVDIV